MSLIHKSIELRCATLLPSPAHRSSILAILSLTAGICLAAPGVEGLNLRVSDAELQPDITLREGETRTAEEYRINGNLYMVKITPTVGVPYYLVDNDGSGDMDLHRGGSAADINIPQWALLSW